MKSREIKFRGWDGDDMLPSQDLTQSSKCWTWLGKQDVELMQYTGLKDKNGVEIYESDLVKIRDAQNDEGFSNQEVYFDWRGAGVIPSEERKMHIRLDMLSEIEVTGNIYEEKK